MEFYHYTTVEKWEEIRKEGLIPGRSLAGTALEDTSDITLKPAIFGLPSPAPKNWLTYEIEDDPRPIPILQHLLYHVGEGSGDDLVLLKVTVEPGDNVHISDYESLWKTYNGPTEPDKAFAKYYKSVTKLRGEFNIRARKLPEILFFDPIPPERIELVKKIPAGTVKEIKAYINAEKRKTGINAATTTPANDSSPKPKKLVA